MAGSWGIFRNFWFNSSTPSHFDPAPLSPKIFKVKLRPPFLINIHLPPPEIVCEPIFKIFNMIKVVVEKIIGDVIRRSIHDHIYLWALKSLENNILQKNKIFQKKLTSNPLWGFSYKYNSYLRKKSLNFLQEKLNFEFHLSIYYKLWILNPYTLICVYFELLYNFLSYIMHKFHIRCQVKL